MNMKKYIVSIVIPIVLFVGVAMFTQPAPVQAASAQDIVNLLVRLGIISSDKADQVSKAISQLDTPISTPVTPSVPGNLPCYNFSKDLSVNTSGSDVVALQTQLISRGFDIPAISAGRTSKGFFGSQTAEALKKYQQSEGVSTTGILNSSTRQELNSSLGCVLPPTPTVISEQVKCVFNGATTEQKCSGVGSYTTTNNGMEIYPPQFYCSGVGSCVTKVSGPKGMKLTWNGSCTGDKLPITTIDGNDEYANFNCGTSSNLPPVINGLDAPTTLSVGQTGTWTVKAYDPENGSLSYSVTWGDEYKTTIGQNTTSNSSVQQFTQSASFIHSYSSTGVYTVNVTVKDSAGLTSQTNATVNVGNVSSTNTPPKIVGFPAIQTGIQPGQMVNISLSATDSDNDDLSWSVDWGENIGEVSSCSSIRRQTGTGWTLNKSHSWANAGLYKVKVTVSDCVGGSDSYSFTVTVGNVTTPSITVLSPNGGESWQKGTTQTIKWQDNTPVPTCGSTGSTVATCSNYVAKKYDIFLDGTSTCSGDVCTMGYRVQTIATGVYGSSYNWRIDDSTGGIGNYYSPGSYRIRICESGTSTCDSSNSYFKIFLNSGSNHAPEILTGSSNAGTIQPGQTVNLGWTAKDADNDDLSWGIEWGDGQGQGSASTGCTQSGQGWAFNTSHSWAQVGTYKVNVTVSDCAKATATSVQYITVGNTSQPQQTTTTGR